MAYTNTLLQPVRAAMLARIDTGAARPRFKVYNSSNTLLATFPLADPAGSVDGSTAVITLTPHADPIVAAVTGTVTYATLEDGDGVVLEDDIPVEAGTAPVTGKLVISTLDLVAGGTVELISATIG
jgi:hypothetical protein